MFTRKLNNFYKRSLKKSMSSLKLNKKENNYSDIDDIKAKEKSILENQDYFKVHNLFNVKDLFDARVHYGHKITSLNDNMRPFLFGSRLGHTIFDLNITAQYFRVALNIVAHIAFRDGIILFISKNPRTTLLVEKTALECKEFAVTREWRFGVFSDSTNVFKCDTRLPDLCIILNTKMDNGFEHPAVVEAARACIPTIGIVDSNCNPNLITYPIPGNDDSYPSILLYCNLFKQAILRGKNHRAELFPNEKNIDIFADDNAVTEVQTEVESKQQIKAEAQVNVESEVRTEKEKSEVRADKVNSEVRAGKVKSKVRAENKKSEVRAENKKSEVRAENKNSEVRADKVKSEEMKAEDKKTVETKPIVDSNK